MADQIPNCCDTRLQLIKKIVLQFQSMTSGLPASLIPLWNDDANDLYRKLLLTLPYI